MRVCVVLCAIVNASACLTVNQFEPIEPKSDIKVPLKPEYISCSLSDIIIITAPIVRDAVYYLTRPDGSTTRLNISRPIYNRNNTGKNRLINAEYDSIAIKHHSVFKTIMGVVNHKVFDLLPDGYGDVEVFEDRTREVNNNDFLIGPLLAEDHGNWVLSLYYQDVRGKWIEMYQVITLEISEYVPPSPRTPMLKPGQTFNFSFAYAIPGLQSCELHAPRSTFDRFYERNMHIDMARCGYSLRNVTVEDQGYWSITGVGRIVYGTQVYLEVKKPEKNVKKRKKWKRRTTHSL